MEIRVFDKSGQFLRKFGRKGEGPGEFIIPSDLTLDSKHDLVCVSDWKNKKISLFQPDGTLHKEIKLKYSPAGFGIDENGNYMVARISSKEDKDLNSRCLQIITIEPDGDIISRSPELTEEIKRSVSVSNGGTLVFSMPFEPKGLIYYRNYSTSFYYAFTDTYKIDVYNNHFHKVKVISKQNPFQKEISDDVKEQFTREYIREGEARNKGELFRMTARYFKFPRYFPLIDALWEDETGRLLVKTPSPDKNVYIDVFDQTGAYIRQWIINTPGTQFSADGVLNAAAVLKGECVYSVVSSNDNLYVKRFRLAETGTDAGKAPAGPHE